jgi:hypothetical protein
LDGSINLLDFNILASNFGGTGNWLAGEFTGDGAIDLLDFNALAANFGLTSGVGGPSPSDWASLASAVPESNPALIVVVSALAALPRRTRRR